MVQGPETPDHLGSRAAGERGRDRSRAVAPADGTFAPADGAVAPADGASSAAGHGVAAADGAVSRDGATSPTSSVAGDPGMWEQLFLQHPSVMLLIDPEDARILAANRAAERFYGWSRSELGSMRISDINTLTPAQVSHEMAAARAEERGYFAFRHRTADGSVRDVEVYSGPVELGGRRFLVSVVHDASERTRAAAALQASEEFARTVVDHAPLGIVVTRLDGVIIQVNPAMAVITGWSEADLIDRGGAVLVHPEDRAAVIDAVQQLDHGEVRAVHLDLRLLRRDADLARVETATTLLHDGEGRVRARLTVVHDVTELRASEARSEQAAVAAQDAAGRAQQAAAQLTETMEAVTDGILLLSEGRITYANPRLCALLACRSEELRGRTVADLLPADLAAAVEAASQAALATRAPRSLTRHHAGIDRWLEVHAYPTAQGLALYLRDVSDRVAREAGLAEAAAAERADADRLRQLDDAKNAFLSAVSHELRTPLTVVRGMAETLVLRGAELDRTQRERLQAALLHHAEQLASQLDDLLQIDRLSRGALTARRGHLDVVALVRRVVADSPVCDRVVLTAPEPCEAELDRVQVEHLLSNLLTNAGKYAPEGPVEVIVAGADDGGVTLTVRDHGPSIPATLREQVFEPYFRVDGDHPSPGTGVGLALVAEFARLHGGRVWVEDAAPGARFVVTLPPHAPEAAASDAR